MRFAHCSTWVRTTFLNGLVKRRIGVAAAIHLEIALLYCRGKRKLLPGLLLDDDVVILRYRGFGHNTILLPNQERLVDARVGLGRLSSMACVGNAPAIGFILFPGCTTPAHSRYNPKALRGPK